MSYGIAVDEEDGSFSVDELRGFVRGVKLVGLLVRRICLQTSCQLIVCIFSAMCVH